MRRAHAVFVFINNGKVAGTPAELFFLLGIKQLPRLCPRLSCHLVFNFQLAYLSFQILNF